MNLISELWAYLCERKKWWRAPVLLLTFVVGALLIVAHDSALAPFIYTIY